MDETPTVRAVEAVLFRRLVHRKSPMQRLLDAFNYKKKNLTGDACHNNKNRPSIIQQHGQDVAVERSKSPVVVNGRASPAVVNGARTNSIRQRSTHQQHTANLLAQSTANTQSSAHRQTNVS